MIGHANLTNSRVLCFALGFSALFFGVSYALFGDVDVYLGDEGYLWYGVVRTKAGEVPLRDFQAYDPGRYYWCAAFASFLGDGLLGLRAAAMVFGAVGLTFGVLVASRFARGLAELTLCGVLLGLWMFPSYKLFEPAFACMATWFAVRLLERPSLARHLAAGLFVGLAGCFGRNHALYAGLAFGLLALLRLWRERPRGSVRTLSSLALGALLGYAPMWLMLLLVPRFAASFLASCRSDLERGTNLPFPWRWPWTTEWSQLAGWDLAAEGALTLAYLLPCILLPLGVLRALRLSAEELGRHAPTVAAAFVGTFYIHHAAVRSDPAHLAQCLPPILLLALGGVTLLQGWRRHALNGALALVLGLAVLEAHPVLSRLRPGRIEKTLVEHQVAGETLRVGVNLARYLERIERAVGDLVGREEELFIASNRPALYPILDRVAPSWWIYPFWAASVEQQTELILHLEERKVAWILINDEPSDDEGDLRFASTHPLVWEYIQREFESIPKLNLRQRKKRG